MKKLLFFAALACSLAACDRDSDKVSENGNLHRRLTDVGIEKNVVYRVMKGVAYKNDISYKFFEPDLTVTFISTTQVKEVQGNHTYICNYEVIDDKNITYPGDFKQAFIKITPVNTNSNNAIVIEPTKSCTLERENGEIFLYQESSTSFKPYKLVK